MSQANTETQVVNEKKANPKTSNKRTRYLSIFALACSLTSAYFSYSTYEVNKHTHELKMAKLQAMQAKLDQEQTQNHLNDVLEINYNGTLSGFLEQINQKTGMSIVIEAKTEEEKAKLAKSHFVLTNFKGSYKEALTELTKLNNNIEISFYFNNAALIQDKG
jgi:hypothetical protein